MKKQVLSLVFTGLSIFSFSQDLDYSFIRTDGQYHYSKNIPTDYFFELLTQELHTQIETDSGNYIYGYPFAFEHHQSDEFEYIDANTGPLADSIFIANNGNTTIYTANGKSFFIKHPFNGNSTWTMYSDDNGNYLRAYYSGRYYTTFYPYLPNVLDTVRELIIRAYDADSNYFSCNLGTNILVSKKYGINRILPFNIIDDIDKYYSIYTCVGIEREDFQEGFSQKESYEDVVLSLEIGSEVHVEYEKAQDERFHFQVRKLVAKEMTDSLVIYTFQYCDSIPSLDTIIETEVVQSWYYKMKNKQLLPAGLVSEKWKYISILRHYNMDWNGKKYFRFMNRSGDEMVEQNGRDYWIFIDYGAMGNSETSQYEFMEEIGYIRVAGGNGCCKLPEIHYYKTQTDEWGTPFSHSCSDNTGISETLSTPITLYPNPAEDVIYIKAPQKIDHATIYDLQGRVVKQFELNSQTSLDVSDLDTGVYLVELFDENVVLLHRKIIIQK